MFFLFKQKTAYEMRISDWSSDVCSSDLSVNIWLTASFSTNHHVNVPIINKYRKVCWVFAIYEGIEIRRAYFMPPGSLEAYFRKWESKWIEEQKDINNPKIPLTFITEHGELVYSDQTTLDLNKAKAVRARSEKRRVGKECVSKCRSRRSPIH